MIIIGQKRKRKVYAERIVVGKDEAGNDVCEFLLSPFEKADHANRRPIARFDSKDELEIAAAGCEILWQ